MGVQGNYSLFDREEQHNLSLNRRVPASDFNYLKRVGSEHGSSRGHTKSTALLKEEFPC